MAFPHLLEKVNEGGVYVWMLCLIHSKHPQPLKGSSFLVACELVQNVFFFFLVVNIT